MTTRPHDAIFKAAFESPEHAAALFRSILPPGLSAAIAWDTLTQEPASFIDPELHDAHGDLLFSAELVDRKVRLYLLLEHQSTVDLDMPLRVLGYLLRIWQHHRKHEPGALPLILHAIVSHAPGGWRGPLTFHELLEPAPNSIPGLAQYVPSFAMLLEDLLVLDDDELEAREMAVFPRLVLWVLRDARDTPRLLAHLPRWAGALGEALAAPSGEQAMMQLLYYVACVGGQVHFEEFHAKIVEHVPRAREVVMTIAEQLRREGWEKGRVEGLEKGRVEGLAATLEKLLTLKFGKLSPAHLQRLRAASSEELERWVERVLSADTIEAVLAP